MEQEQVLVELVEVLVDIELLVMAHHHYEDLHDHRNMRNIQLQLEQEHLVITHHTLQEVLVQMLQER